MASGGERVGFELLKLVNSMPDWIHRRVDAVRLHSGGATRWHASIDSSPPFWSLPSLGSDVLLPIAFIEKQQLIKFDIGLGDRSSVPVLTTDQNSQYSLAILQAAARSAFAESIYGDQEFNSFLESIVSGDVFDSKHAYLEFAEWWRNGERQARSDGEAEASVFFQLLETFVLKFLLIAQVPRDAVPQRAVLKYSHAYESATFARDESSSIIRKFFSTSRILENMSFRSHLTLELDDYASAGSYHFEVQVPQEIAVRRLTLTEDDNDGRNGVQDESVIFEEPISQLAHIHRKPSGRWCAAKIRVDLEPVNGQGIYSVAKLSVLASLAICLAALVLKWFPSIIGEGFEIPSPAASIVVGGFAAFLSWAFRPNEHDVVSTVLSPIRRIILLQVIALVMVAAKLSLPLVPLWSWLAWGTIWLIELFAVVWFFVAACGLRPDQPKGGGTNDEANASQEEAA